MSMKFLCIHKNKILTFEPFQTIKLIVPNGNVRDLPEWSRFIYMTYSCTISQHRFLTTIISLCLIQGYCSQFSLNVKLASVFRKRQRNKNDRKDIDHVYYILATFEEVQNQFDLLINLLSIIGAITLQELEHTRLGKYVKFKETIYSKTQ